MTIICLFINIFFQTFADHPLVYSYNCLQNNTYYHGRNSSFLSVAGITTIMENSSYSFDLEDANRSYKDVFVKEHNLYKSEPVMQPNTALLSLILTLGTFLIAYFLRIFRNSRFLGRSVSNLFSI